MKLQFTNGYRPRFDQISRIMQFLLTKDDQKKISRKEIIAGLGIPDKQIENLTSMMTGFGLINTRITTLTSLGKAIIQGDPYFDKLETLWIIHYLVSSNPEWVVWYRIINIVLPVQDTYEVDKISNQYFSDLEERYSERTFSEKLPKEVGAVLASYSRSDLSRLQLLEAEATGNFKKLNQVDIPDLAFLFCLLSYRDRYSPGSTAINTDDVCLAENSPGRVINLPEYSVRSILGRLHDRGVIRLEKVANLDQVRLAENITQDAILKMIYLGA